MYLNEVIWYGVPIVLMMIIWIFGKSLSNFKLGSAILSLLNVGYAYMIYFHDTIDSLLTAGEFHLFDWLLTLFSIATVCGVIYIGTFAVLFGISWLVSKIRFKTNYNEI